METSIFLLCLAIIFDVAASEETVKSIETSKIDLLSPAESKISELYIGDLLRTNTKEKLDTASINLYQITSTPNYISADELRDNSDSTERGRIEILPPLALNGQIGRIQQLKRSDGNPVNLFEKFLDQQSGLLRHNVLEAGRNMPSSRRASRPHDHSSHTQKDCDKHAPQSASSEDSAYAYNQEPHQQRSLRPIHNNAPRHRAPYANNHRDSREHYSSHSAPVYSKSTSGGADNSDSNSKSLSSYSQSKSFSSSKTTSPNKVREKVIIAAPPPPHQQNYDNSYNSGERTREASVHHGRPGAAPSSYETESPAQYESYPPASQSQPYFQDYSPPKQSRPVRNHFRQSSMHKPGRNYSPQSHHHSPQYKQQQPHEYSHHQEYQPEYPQEDSKASYETTSIPKLYKPQNHRDNYEPHQPSDHYRPVQNQNPNHGSYHFKPNQHDGHPASNHERSRQMSTHSAREERRKYSHRSPGGPQERGFIPSLRQSRTPVQSRSASNSGNPSVVNRMYQTPEPLEEYDTQIVTNREKTENKSPRLQSKATSDQETHSVEESQIKNHNPQETQSSTSKSVSFSESTSFHLDEPTPLQPKARSSQTARTYPEPQKLTNHFVPSTGQVQSRNTGYPMIYKPYNSEYPASYVNEQRQYPIHNIEHNGGRQFNMRQREAYREPYHEQQPYQESYEDDEEPSPHHVKSQSNHKYKSDITGYKDEYHSSVPLELDDAFFEKYGISKKAKIIVATAKKPNVFVADGSHLKEGQSNSNTAHESSYSPEEDGPYHQEPEASYEQSPEAPYNHNSEENGPLEKHPVLYHNPESHSIMTQLPDSYDSLIHTNPTFLRNSGVESSRYNEFANTQESSEENLPSRNSNIKSKSYVISSHGDRELVQKHGDGVSRIFNHSKDKQQFDESKKIETFKPSITPSKSKKTQSNN